LLPEELLNLRAVMLANNERVMKEMQQREKNRIYLLERRKAKKDKQK
jgi:hypothetical protein